MPNIRSIESGISNFLLARLREEKKFPISFLQVAGAKKISIFFPTSCRSEKSFQFLSRKLQEQKKFLISFPQVAGTKKAANFLLAMLREQKSLF